MLIGMNDPDLQFRMLTSRSFENEKSSLLRKRKICAPLKDVENRRSSNRSFANLSRTSKKRENGLGQTDIRTRTH